MAGIDLNTVRELLGHADISTTLRYAHLAREHKAFSVEQLINKEMPSDLNFVELPPRQAYDNPLKKHG